MLTLVGHVPGGWFPADAAKMRAAGRGPVSVIKPTREDGRLLAAIFVPPETARF